MDTFLPVPLTGTASMVQTLDLAEQQPINTPYVQIMENCEHKIGYIFLSIWGHKRTL